MASFFFFSCKIHYFCTPTPFPTPCATQHIYICTHSSVRHNEEKRSRKNSTSIDTFTHQEKYQLFVFTRSTATPFRLPCPTSHSPRTFNSTSALVHHHPALYTASDIRHCARCRCTDELSAPARRRKYRSSKQCFTRGCLESGVDQRRRKAPEAGTAVCG